MWDFYWKAFKNVLLVMEAKCNQINYNISSCIQLILRHGFPKGTRSAIEQHSVKTSYL